MCGNIGLLLALAAGSGCSLPIDVLEVLRTQASVFLYSLSQEQLCSHMEQIIA
jgi:hypothetical protein